MSPTELVRSFMEYAHGKGRTEFPPLFHGTKAWHEFLYKLKSTHLKRFPELECIGDFDWDGPYPTAQRWHEVQTSLCIHGACAGNFQNRTFLIPKFIRKENVLAKDRPELFKTMLNTAESVENFFNPGTYQCLLCGTTTLLPHVCPAFNLPATDPIRKSR
jgi:hypothetical protein